MTKVTITTAVALTDKQRELIQKSLKSAHPEGLEMVETIDATVLGGVRLRIGSQELDGTLKALLNQVRTTLLSQI